MRIHNELRLQEIAIFCYDHGYYTWDSNDSE